MYNENQTPFVRKSSFQKRNLASDDKKSNQSEDFRKQLSLKKHFNEDKDKSLRVSLN